MAGTNTNSPQTLSAGRILLIMSSLVLSTVMASLNSSTSEIVWVTLGYLVAASGPMLLAARMADGLGHARFFQIGTTVYALAMIACAWARLRWQLS